jgi:hypothetical protein
MEEKEKSKTAFATRRGLFQFQTMPFGLCNAPATFKRLMERVLKGLQWVSCLVYLDDIIIFAKSFDEMMSRLQEILDRLRGAGLKLKPSKCFLFQKQVAYLGHVVGRDGISCDEAKVTAVIQ